MTSTLIFRTARAAADRIALAAHGSAQSDRGVARRHLPRIDLHGALRRPTGRVRDGAGPRPRRSRHRERGLRQRRHHPPGVAPRARRRPVDRRGGALALATPGSGPDLPARRHGAIPSRRSRRHRTAACALVDAARYAYLPFGAGPRICIGSSFAMMEAVAVLALLISRYRLSLRPDYAPRIAVRVTLRPARGLMMQLHRRAGRGGWRARPERLRSWRNA